MAIYAYVGLPGSGKSHSAVEHVVIPALKDGRTVWTNLPLLEDHLRELAGPLGDLHLFDSSISAHDLVSTSPPGAVLVIDEIARYWRAGVKANMVPIDEFEFFSMHRHRVGPDGKEPDIYIICQDLGSGCASFIRDLVQLTFRTVKLDAVGSSKRYRVDVFRGPVKGQKPPESLMVRQTFGKYDPKIFACYRSHTMSDGTAGSAATVDKRGNVWRSWKIKAAAVSLLLLPFVLWWVVHSFRSLGRSSGIASAHVAEHGEATSAKPTLPAFGSASVSASPRISGTWRTSGLVAFGKNRYVLLDGPNGGRWVDAGLCSPLPARGWRCPVDGEIATPWSGQLPSAASPAVSLPHLG